MSRPLTLLNPVFTEMILAVSWRFVNIVHKTFFHLIEHHTRPIDIGALVCSCFTKKFAHFRYPIPYVTFHFGIFRHSAGGLFLRGREIQATICEWNFHVYRANFCKILNFSVDVGIKKSTADGTNMVKRN